ncbi:MAG: hypothetical protein AAGE52_27690 [Myxococcota bacterium]
MSDPIRAAAGLSIQLEPTPSAAPTQAPEQSFSEVMEQTEASPFLDALAGAARSMAASDRALQRGLRSARRGQGMDPARLLALQSGVYRYAQEVELASKLVDKATSAVKTTLQSQQ